MTFSNRDIINRVQEEQTFDFFEIVGRYLTVIMSYDR